MTEQEFYLITDPAEDALLTEVSRLYEDNMVAALAITQEESEALAKNDSGSAEQTIVSYAKKIYSKIAHALGEAARQSVSGKEEELTAIASRKWYAFRYSPALVSNLEDEERTGFFLYCTDYPSGMDCGSNDAVMEILRPLVTGNGSAKWICRELDYADALTQARAACGLSDEYRYLDKGDSYSISHFIHYAIAEDSADAVEGTSILQGSAARLLGGMVDTYIMPVNKLANAMSADIIDAGLIDLIVSSKGAVGKNEIASRCLITYEGNDVELTGRQKYTEYDRAVNNAVTSLYVYGSPDHKMTADMIYRTMTGMRESESPSPQQLGAVTRSINKQRFIRVNVKCADELLRRGITEIDGKPITDKGDVLIDTYLLMASAITTFAGSNREKSAFILHEVPVLYRYSSMVKQVANVSIELLDIKDNGQRVSNTTQRIAIKNLLLRRIEAMRGKSGASLSRRIRFDTIAEESGTSIASKAQAKRLREYVFLCLDYWKQRNYIQGYNVVKTNREYTSVEIML